MHYWGVIVLRWGTRFKICFGIECRDLTPTFECCRGHDEHVVADDFALGFHRLDKQPHKPVVVS